MDNYAYIIVDKDTGTTAVIDPSEAKPVFVSGIKNDIVR